MTLPIANGLAGSAGQPLPEDAVCDWKVATKATFAIGRGRLKARLRLEGSRLKRPFAIGKGFPTYSPVPVQ
jgi:hypothetical protein